MSAPVRRWKDSKEKPMIKGKWSEKEINHLKRLLCKYASKKSLTPDQLASICGDTTPPEFSNIWTKLANFFPNRSVQSVHNICKRYFNPFNYKGPWTLKEERILIEFVNKNGHKWKELGELLQRTALNIKDKWKQMGGERMPLRKTGTWNVEETKELVMLVFKLFKVPTDKIEEISTDEGDQGLNRIFEVLEMHKKVFKKSEIAWEAISELFQTRSAQDCRTRWSYIINNKIPNQMVFSVEEDVKLFEGIRRQNVNTIEKINYEKIDNGKTSEDNKHRFKVLAKATSGRLRLSLNEILEKLEFSYNVATGYKEETILDYYTSKYPIKGESN